MGVSTMRLFAFAMIATMMTVAYGDARKCYYIATLTQKKDAKPEQVTCANADNQYCWSYTITVDGKTAVQKVVGSCSGTGRYVIRAVLRRISTAGAAPAIRSTVESQAVRASVRATGSKRAFREIPETDCCDKDYCNAAARSSLGFGLVTVAFAVLFGKAAM
ncbi:hypothetical protein AAVH_08087 [Aphelenchoides avenae]|nr:hypothetical protein AAVH_08087 [Aphelenchus avenae]